MMPATTEQLKALKVGDKLYIRNARGLRELTITKVGTKYLTTSDFNNKVSLATARTHHPTHTQWENEVYLSEADLLAYEKYCRDLDEARTVIRTCTNRLKNTDLIAVATIIKSLVSQK